MTICRALFTSCQRQLTQLANERLWSNVAAVLGWCLVLSGQDVPFLCFRGFQNNQYKQLSIYLSKPWYVGLFYKLRYIVGFRLVVMAISTNPKPTIYRNLYENMDPEFTLSVLASECHSIGPQQLWFHFESFQPLRLWNRKMDQRLYHPLGYAMVYLSQIHPFISKGTILLSHSSQRVALCATHLNDKYNIWAAIVDDI